MPLAIRDLQIKTTLRFHFISSEWPRSRIQRTKNDGLDVEEKGVFTVGGGRN